MEQNAAQNEVRTLTIPRMGEGQVDVRILAFRKAPGDPVARDEPLYEMETAKSAVEIESPVAGVLGRWLVAEGETVDIGAPVAEIREAVSRSGSPGGGKRPMIPPRTRAHAQRLGLSAQRLAEIPARTRFLTPEDVDEHLRTREGEPSARFSEERLSERQLALNEAMRAASGNVVGAVVATTLDAGMLTRATGALTADLPDSGLVTEFQVLAYCAARAAAGHRRLCSRRIGADRLRVFGTAGIGIAVSTVDGDVHVAGLPAASAMPFGEFCRRYAEGVERGMAGESTVDGTITLLMSHLGEEADDAVPVVVPPASATLFLGAARGTAYGAARRLVLSFDHCVLNGQQAAEYLAAVRAELAGLGDSPGPAPVRDRDDRLPAVLAIAEEVVGHPVDPRRPFGEQGVDSARAVALVRVVNARFGINLPPTALWRFPTLAGLAEAVPMTEAGPAAAGMLPSGAPAPGAEDIAVIGMACRVPGAADLEELWELLRRGESAFGRRPPARLCASDPLAGTGTSAALLDGIDRFDAEFFEVSPRQAAAMDPQQRLLLELTWHAFENAGMAPDSVAGTEVGVLIATSSYDYREQLIGAGCADGYATIGTLPAFLANRISHYYDLRGPSAVVDTACSAGLTAIVSAISALRAGNCSLALVGAANLLSSTFNTTAYHQAQMTSPTGRLHAFDERADGFVRGEGAAVVVLKPLCRALTDGDTVHAVLRGAAMNHGGRAASLTAPSPGAQAELIRTALRKASVQAGSLGYLEAHGTGTALGDPIEVDALREVLAERPGGAGAPAAGPGGRLWLGTVKANIGHLEGAAGLIGLIKAVLVVREGMIPAVPGFARLNPAINLGGTPLAVADRAIDWPADPARPRIAAVSSFGFGGSNAHVVVQQPPAVPPTEEVHHGLSRVFPLSVRTEWSARELAGKLAGWLRSGMPSMADFAWTLQIGRQALPVRVALVCADRAGLLDALTALASGVEHEDVLRAGQPARVSAALVRHGVCDRDALVTRWLDGGPVDWRSGWAGATPRRIPLPGYPFGGRSHWIHPELWTGARAFRVGWIAEERPPTVIERTGPLAVVHDEASRRLAARLITGLSEAHLLDIAAVERGELPAAAEWVLVVGGVEWTVSSGPQELRRWLRVVATIARYVGGSRAAGRIRLVTTGLCAPAGGTVAASQALQGALLGAIRSIPAEYPSVLAALVDLPAPGDLSGVLAEPVGEVVPLVSLSPSARFRQVFVPLAERPGAGFCDGGAYLVLGGTGGIGAEIARHLARRYHADLLLAGRSPDNDAITQLAAELLDSGAGQVHYRIADLATAGTVDLLLAECDRLLGRLDGVVHAVGTVRDGLIDQLTGTGIETVLVTKVDAVLELYQRLRSQRPGATLLLCSSVAGAFGSRGGFSYAAVSSFLGSFAEAVGPQGRPAVRTIDWGLWRDTGLARHYGDRIRAAYPGLAAFGPAEGVAALETTLAGTAAHTLVVAGDPVPLRALTADGTGSARYALERYALDVVRVMADELGVPGAAVLPATVEQIAERTGVVSGYRPLLAALLALLVDDGLLTRSGDRFQTRQWSTPHDLARDRTELVRRHPDLAGHLRLVDRVLAQHRTVLRGGQHYSAALFPEGDLDLVAAIYQDNGLFEPANRAVAEAVAARAEDGRRLRVVEVGAGVGATTAAVLDATLQAGIEIHYTYTDLSLAFLNRGRERFGNRIQTHLLDLERPLAEQGISPGTADVVVASNVLHATSDLRRTLGSVRALLASGGRLLLTEMTRPGAAYTVSFGLTEGWWRCADDRLPHSPLLDLAAWQDLLAETGWTARVVYEGDDAPGRLAVLACDPATAEPAGPTEVAGRLRELVRGLLGDPDAEVGTDRPWQELGVDSLLLSELAGLVEKEFAGVTVRPAELFGYPTVTALAGHVAARLTDCPPGRAEPGAVKPAAPATTTPAVPASAGTRAAPWDEPVAVIGLAGRFPGASDVDGLWRLLSEGHSPVREVPPERWDWRVARTVNGGYARWGCFLEDWDHFDPQRFGIPPRDAAMLDPQERLFLETATQAFEVAGYSGAHLGGAVGVFAGVTGTSHLLDQHDRRRRGADNPEYAVSAFSSVANRVSYLFDLRGPSLAVDTMCSSSLTALHLACRSLADGECELALAGGVNLYLHPDRFAGLCALGMPSPAGRTSAFGLPADGFVPGEAVAAVVLKPLSAALADGDPVHAVLRASAVNHGGRSSGYTAPNPGAQAELIGYALHRAGVAPHTIGYVEAHGTGTELGDPIELWALATAFSADPAVRPGGIALGSVKPNLGHSEAAAGITGLLKVILQLRHGRLARTLWADRVNPLLELDRTPFRLQCSDEAWPSGDGPRRATVSSFGAGGSNAHIVVESAPEREGTAAPDGPVVIPLSAPDRDRLRRVARELRAALTGAAPTIYAVPGTPLPEIAATLARRDGWPHRAALCCRDHRELVDALAALDTATSNPAVLTEDRPDADPAAREWLRSGTASAAAARRVALPPTPLAARRCEIPVPRRRWEPPPASALPLVSEVAEPAVLDLTSRLMPTEPCFAEHIVDGRPVLAGAFLIELVLEGLLATGVSPFDVELTELSWSAPLSRAPAELRVRVTAEPGDRCAVTVREGADLLLEAGVQPGRPELPVGCRSADLAALLADGADGAEGFYQRYLRCGFAYGPALRPVRRYTGRGGEAVAELILPDAAPGLERAVLHPSLLDGALQVAASMWAREPGLRLRPMGVRRLVVHRPATGPLFVHARSGTGGAMIRGADIRIVDAEGRLVAALDGFAAKAEPAPPSPASAELGMYRLGWRVVAPSPGAPVPTDRLLVVGNAGTGLARGLGGGAPSLTLEQLEERADALRAAEVVLIDLSEHDLGLGGQADADHQAEFRRALDETLLPLVRALRTLLRARATARVLVVVPEGNEPVLRGMHGMVTTANSETAQLGFRLIAVTRDVPARVLLDEVSTPGEGWVRLRAGERAIAALAAVPEPAGDPLRPRPDGCYLVSGGLGGLGRAVAAELLRRCPGGAVVLLGRSTADGEALARLRALAPEAEVRYVRCDVGDPAAVRTVVAGLRADGLQPNGVLHLAGVLRDGFLRGKTAEQVEAVVRPKLLGALVLDHELAADNLDFFVTASSLAALSGNPGQADYALANGFLDGFAVVRSGWVAAGLRSGRSLSLGLPLLSRGGLRPSREVIDHLVESHGLRPLPVETVARLLWRWLSPTADSPAQLAVVSGDQDRWRSAHGVLEADLVPGATPAIAGSARERAVTWITGRLAEVTGLDPAGIEPTVAFDRYGIDSVGVMRLNRVLEVALGKLPRTLAFDTGTVGNLTDALLGSHREALLAAALPAAAADPVRTPALDIGGAVRLGECQAGIWLADQEAGQHAPYNISLAWQLPENVDLSALGRALEGLSGRHPVLTSTVSAVDGELTLRPGVSHPPEYRRLDRRELDIALRTEADQPFRLTEEPPLRALLWRITDTGRTVLQLVTHHLVVDGRSAEILTEDLAAGYQAVVEGRPIPPPDGGFLRYLARLTEPTEEATRLVWSARLADPPAAPRFADGDPTAAPFTGGHREFRLPKHAVDVREDARFPLLLGAFALAVARRTGAARLLVAVPAYGRPDPADERMVGCLTNSVLVRVGLPADQTVGDWLRALRVEVSEAVADSEHPYPRLVELCRHHGGEWAVPTLSFTLHNWGDRQAVPELLRHRVFRRGQQGHFDLAIEVADTGAELDLLVSHRMAALSPDAVDELADDLRWLAHRLGRDASASLNELLRLEHDTLHYRFLRQAVARPEALAASDADRKLSYDEVARRSAALADCLLTMGVGGQPIGVLAGRTVELPVALLGVLRAGSPYVPLDETYPAQRMEQVCRSAGCALVLVEPHLAGRLPDGIPAVRLDELRGGIRPPADAAVTGADPAYLMYTSGSTGTPKGVTVSHRNVLHLLDSMADLLGWRPGLRTLALSTVCFDISVLELFLPLLHGGSVHIGDRATAVDGRRFAATLDRERIDLVQATPSGWQLLLDSGWTSRADLVALCGGEELPQALAGRLVARVRELWNLYGPTESTIWSTAARLRGGEPVHLGGPIGGTDLVLLASDGTEAATGTGELWIGGPGTATGYWRQPELTAERFTGHPARPDAGGRFFRTGDLVRRDPDGRLIFCGRADAQVKVRGHRVELAEVERVLAASPELAGVVVHRAGEGAEARLVAEVVPAEGAPSPTVERLRAFAGERLPPWMLPEAVRVRSSFPLTLNGKIDRTALALAEPVVTQGDSVVDRVAACWRAVLGADGFGVDQAFFAVGGNSMKLIRLQATLEAEFAGRRIDVTDLFANPTVRKQAELLTRDGRAPNRDPSTERMRERTPSPQPSRRELRRALRSRNTSIDAPGRAG